MKILVIEDNDDIRMLLEFALTAEGHEVSGAGGGPEALQMLEEGHQADLVLLDVQMPVLDGWDTLRAIRSNPATSDLPVILCTVKGSPADRALGWKLGCDGYVSKPFHPDLLIAAVDAVTARTPEERHAAREAGLAEAQEAAVGSREEA